MADDKTYKILIETTFKGDGTKQASESVKQLGVDSQKSAQGTKDISKSLTDVGRTKDSITKVGVELAAIGAVMSGAILKGAKDYVSAVGMGSAVSRSWQASTLQLQDAYTKIGGVFATTLLPLLQEAANLADKIANFFQKNPELAKLVVGAAGAATVVGGTALAVVQGAKTITAIQTIGAALGATGSSALFGAAAKGAATVAVDATAPEGAAVAGASGAGAAMAGVIVGGVLLGLAGNQALSQTKLGQEEGVQPTNKILTVVAYELGTLVQKLGGPNSLALSWASNVGGATGALAKPAAAAPASDMNTGNGFISTQLLQETLQYQISETRAEQDFHRQQFTATRDFNIQLQYAQDDYQLQVYRSTRDFYLQQEYSAQDYYIQASHAQRDYNISVSRSDQDYQISRTRAAEDHNFDMQQIMLSGDFLQAYYSERQYNLTTARADQDFNLQKSRAAQDFAKTQSDSEQQFQISNARQQQQFQIQEADAAQNFQIQQKRSQDQFDIQMSDMDYNYKLQRQRAATDFQNEILPELDQEKDYRLAIEQELDNSFIQMLNQVSANQNAAATTAASQKNLNSGTDIGGVVISAMGAFLSSNPLVGTALMTALFPGRAEGGYVNQGLYQLHSNEFVLNAGTTQAAESVAKGNLSQDKIVQMLSGANGGLTVNNNQSFSRGMSPDEKDEIRASTRKLLIDALS